MHCAACPADRRTFCQSEGCCARLAEIRVATVVGPAPPAALQAARAGFGLLQTDDELAPQLARLDVENGDILVLRTRSKLTPEKSERWQGKLTALCRAQGVHDVSVLVLDDCTDLTVERPKRPDTRMAHQAPRPAPIVSC